MTGTKFDIEKFDGTNDFALWQVRMNPLLEQQGLSAALEELPATAIVSYDNVIRKKAYIALILFLGDRKKLYTFNMHPGKSQSEHIDEFHKLVGDLAAIDTAILDKDQALLLLTSLYSSYDNFVETLLYGRDTLKLKDEIWSKRYEARKSQGFVRNDQVSGYGADGECRVRGTCKVQVQMRDGSSFVLDNVGQAVTSKTLKGMKRLEEYQTGWKIKTDNVTSKVVLYKNMGFNESEKYKKTFIGSDVGTGSVHVLQGVEFEVKPQEDHTSEVEPHGNIDHVVGSQEVQAQDLIYYHPVRDREQHSSWEL
nr:retrovirus-related Pol polyprotein from transposon TNT 1-94 [Tanacetum cinerariifolium]